jgi:hypothetical protein
MEAAGSSETYFFKGTIECHITKCIKSLLIKKSEQKKKEEEGNDTIFFSLTDLKFCKADLVALNSHRSHLTESLENRLS